MCELVAMRAEHVERMAAVMAWSAGELENARASIVGDHCYALVDGIETLALFGGHRLQSGVAQVWSVIGNPARKFPVTLTRMVLRLLNLYQKNCGIHRFQISVKLEDRRAVQWAQVLGFSCEGRMRKYGPDKSDYWLYGRI